MVNSKYRHWNIFCYQANPSFHIISYLYPWFIIWARWLLDILKQIERMVIVISRYLNPTLSPWRSGKENVHSQHNGMPCLGLSQVVLGLPQELEFTRWQFSLLKRIFSSVGFRKIYFLVSSLMFMLCTKIYSNSFYFESSLPFSFLPFFLLPSLPLFLSSFLPSILFLKIEAIWIFP